MPVTLGKITARILVQIADNDPVEVGTMNIDLPIDTTQTAEGISARVRAVVAGAAPDHEHVWSYASICVSCGAHDDTQLDHGGWEDH